MRTPKEAADKIITLTLELSKDRAALKLLREQLEATQARADAAEKILRAQAARHELDIPPSWMDLHDAEVEDIVNREMEKKGQSREETMRAFVRFAASRKRSLAKYEESVKDVKVRK